MITPLKPSILFIVFLLVIHGLVGDYIHYGPLHDDVMHGFPCNRLHPDRCEPPQSNDYRRGCETEDQCRGGLRKDFGGGGLGQEDPINIILANMKKKWFWIFKN